MACARAQSYSPPIISAALIFLTVFVVLCRWPFVFAQGFFQGIGAYVAALSDPEALSAI